MASNVNPFVPAEDSDLLSSEIRSNFSTIKTELETLEENIPIAGVDAGNVVFVIDAQTDPDGDPIPALPAIDARLLTNLPLPAFDANRVAVPATQSSPGIPGQWAEDSAWRYHCIAENVWVSWELRKAWERLEFVGPNISPISAQVGDTISVDVSGQFTGVGRTYSLIDAPAWLSIDASGVISGTAEIGTSAVTVRATVGEVSVDSNPAAVGVSVFMATDFSEYAVGDWSETYLYSNVNAVLEIIEIGPTSSEAALRTKDNNATASLWFSERVEITAAEMGDADWETLALVRVSDINCRIGTGYMDGTASAASIACFEIKLFDSPPRILSAGSSLSGASTPFSVEPAEWVDQFIWLHIRRVGAQTQARAWMHETAIPAWGNTRTYTSPALPAATAGLGWFMQHRQTDVQAAEILYFACQANGQSLQVPAWTAPSFPAIEAGDRAYLAIWEPKAAPASTADTVVDAWNYPLVGLGDAAGNYYDAVMRRAFVYYAASNPSFFPELASRAMPSVKATTQESAFGINGLLFANQFGPIDALSPYTDESAGKLFPGHVAYQAGATLALEVASATGQVMSTQVDAASKIRTGHYALIMPAPGAFGNLSLCEWVYVTGRNLTADTITFTRGWGGPLNHAGPSVYREHPVGAYIASVTTGGAADGTKASTGLNPVPLRVATNWKWNMSTQCPQDSNATTIHPHLVGQVKRKFAEAHAVLGYYPMAYHDDVDRPSYNTQEMQIDCNNDGIADFGYSDLTMSGVHWWREGVQAFQQALIAEIGPGTAYNVRVFMGGTDNSDATLYSGAEAEAGFFDNTFRVDNEGLPENERVMYTRPQQKLLTALFEHGQLDHIGPRFGVRLCRAFTQANPCLQDKFGEAKATDPCNYFANSNKVARLTMTLAWCLGDVFAMPMEATTIGWWDEYSCDTANGYACPQYKKDGTGDTSEKLVGHTGWMGKPLGKMVRHYDASVGVANDIGYDMTAATNPLGVENVSAERLASGGPGNAAFWRYTQTQQSALMSNSIRIYRTKSGLTDGAYYTAVLALRSPDGYRRIGLSINGQGLIPVGNDWLYYPFTFKASGTSQYFLIQLGSYYGRLDIGAFNIMPGRADAFSRDFDRALVLANPGTDPYTFTLPVGANYQRLLGTQDPSVNNGEAVSGSIEVPARDGLILAKVL